MINSLSLKRRSCHAVIPDWRLFFKTRWKVIIFFLIGIFLLEVLIFNMPTWQTLFTSAKIDPISSLQSGDLKVEKDGFISEVSNPTLRITSNRVLKYLYLEVPPEFEHTSQQLNYLIGVSYQGDKYVHYGNIQTLSLGVKNDRYINCGSYVKTVTLQLRVAKGTFVPVNAITVNPKIPYRFSPLRLLILLLICSFWILLGPGSILWKMELDTTSAFHVFLLLFVTLAVLFFYFVTWYFNANAYQWGGVVNLVKNPNGFWISDRQYENLANSLLHGHTWLNLPVSSALKALKNPYSSSARIAIGQRGGYWFVDHAFYHGKYYSYFGVIPAVIFFLPFEMITGKEMLSGWAVFIALLVASIFATLLVIRIAKLWFDDSSLAAVICAVWMMAFGCGMLQDAFVADFYEVPIATSYMFTVLGLWCWLKSIKIRRQGKGEKYISPWWVFFGSLFMACNLGCRPSFIAFSLLAIPIFWTATFKERLLFSKKGIWASVMLIFPFLLIYTPLLMYNYDRFGSALNFGENYNLTGFDMTRATRPSFPFLLSLVFSHYWFQPLNLTGSFPFITSIRMSNTSTGIGTTTPLWYPMDPAVGGGYFTFTAPWVFIFFCAAPFVFSRRRRNELERSFSGKYVGKESTRRTITALVCISVAMGICITFIAAQLCGFSQRYEGCFGTLFSFASILILFSALPARVCREREKQGLILLLKILLVVLLITTCIWEFLGLCDLGRRCQNSTVHVFRVASWFLFMN